MLNYIHAALPGANFGAQLRAESDVYLATARSLLSGGLVAPVDGGNTAEVQRLFDLATAATGSASASVFGLQRDVDFSQFEPRGHYVADPQLQQYLRALIWLGRMDLRVIDVDPGTGAPLFRREQLAGAVALRQLMSAADRTT